VLFGLQSGSSNGRPLSSSRPFSGLLAHAGLAAEALPDHAAGPGTSSIAHLAENLAAAALRLVDDEFELLGSM
jgi:hypothetical protein